MSCSSCEDEPITGAFLRWHNANVEIIACKKHWLEIRDALMDALKNKYGDDSKENTAQKD